MGFAEFWAVLLCAGDLTPESRPVFGARGRLKAETNLEVFFARLLPLSAPLGVPITVRLLERDLNFALLTRDLCLGERAPVLDLVALP